MSKHKSLSGQPRLVPRLLLSVLLVPAAWNSSAQADRSSENLRVVQSRAVPWTASDPATIDGSAEQQILVKEQGNIRVARVRFQPGAHTRWHIHRDGQVLYIESGHGLVQVWGGPVREVGPGDVVYTAPGEKHWHGAASDSAFTHVTVSVGPTEWREDVAPMMPIAPNH